jgi:hypothetical protein
VNISSASSVPKFKPSKKPAQSRQQKGKSFVSERSSEHGDIFHRERVEVAICLPQREPEEGKSSLAQRGPAEVRDLLCKESVEGTSCLAQRASGGTRSLVQRVEGTSYLVQRERASGTDELVCGERTSGSDEISCAESQWKRRAVLRREPVEVRDLLCKESVEGKSSLVQGERESRWK